MAPQRGEKASLGANCLRVAGSLKKRLQSLDEPRGRGVPAGAALLSNETQPGHALDRATPLWQKARGLRDAQATPARCRSSVVEHSLGKGEVESSILSGSTSNCSLFLLRTLRFPCRGSPAAPGLINGPWNFRRRARRRAERFARRIDGVRLGRRNSGRLGRRGLGRRRRSRGRRIRGRSVGAVVGHILLRSGEGKRFPPGLVPEPGGP